MAIKQGPIELRVKEVRPEDSGALSAFFYRPANFEFEAGDWMDLAFADRNLRGGITYSISSSPTEIDIRITFRQGFSDSKKALQGLVAGEIVSILQYGNDYDFSLDRNRSSVLIAGGIGIAPLRSMIKELYDTQGRDEISLIYLSQQDTFLFKDELDKWSDKLPNLTVHYIQTRTINRKQRESIIKSLLPDLDQHFYIAGPKGMVEANEHLLIDMGVKLKNIRIDSFRGY